MNSKKINKLFNKIIGLLIILVVIIYGKNVYEKSSYAFDEKTVSESSIESNLDVYFFDVGQADSILIRNENDTVLIDAGNRNDGENLVTYIKDELNIDNIDIVFGTHPHEDHVGGMSYIIDNFDIDDIYLPDATSNSKFFENLLDSIEKKEYKISVPTIDEDIKLGNLDFKVLYVGKEESDLNSTSIVLKLTYGETSFLFMGDAPKKVENIILDKDIDVDVLKVGHHGSKYSSGLEFLKKVSPKYSIIEVGKNNNYNHPDENTIKRLNDMNSKVYRTDLDGTIKLVSDGKSINIETIKTNIDG